jgi:hypothetical protein
MGTQSNGCERLEEAKPHEWLFIRVWRVDSAAFGW